MQFLQINFQRAGRKPRHDIALFLLVIGVFILILFMLVMLVFGWAHVHSYLAQLHDLMLVFALFLLWHHQFQFDQTLPILFQNVAFIVYDSLCHRKPRYFRSFVLFIQCGFRLFHFAFQISVNDVICPANVSWVSPWIYTFSSLRVIFQQEFLQIVTCFRIGL